MAPKAKPAETDSSLKREVAGRYITRDARFAIEQSSSGWLLIDNEATDELGQPLVRGQFATLDGARGAIDDARSGPPPVSELEVGRAQQRAQQKDKRATPGRRGTSSRRATPAPRRAAAPPETEVTPVHIREYRRSDGKALRDLWREAGFRLLGDDDDSLATMARRNPGLMLVATAGKRIVGSALGAWDGRHGWIYHMATAESHRRSGVGRSLVREVEQRLAAVGCHDVNVNVGDANATAQQFWVEVGYPAVGTRRYRKELSER